MAKRSDEFEFQGLEALKAIKAAPQFTGFVTRNKKEAEIEALTLRLHGKSAFVQTGYEGNYEVVASQHKGEIRKLTADYKELGAGLYQEVNPSWDSGNIWTLHSINNDGSVMIARIAEDELEELGSDELFVESELSDKVNCSNLPVYGRGEEFAYVNDEGRITVGKVERLDYEAGCYVVRSAETGAYDYVSLAAATDLEDLEDLTYAETFDDEAEELEKFRLLDDAQDQGEEILEDLIEDHEEMVDGE